VLGSPGLVHDHEEGPQALAEAPWTPVHDDLVQRDFSAPGARHGLVDRHQRSPTAKAKLYACCIKDVFWNRIVGCATGERMTADLAVSALRQAIARRQPEGTVVVHSDRGGQFRARSFVAVLKANNLTGSMGRVSSAGDNAAMESFHSLLQKNVLDRQRWTTRAELANAILVWIEYT